MSSFSERLEAVIPPGVSQAEFAASVGTSLGSLRNWLNGRNEPNVKVARAIADLYDLDLNWLISGTKKDAIGSDNFVHVRRFDVEASAGDGIVVQTEDYLAPIAFEEDWLRKHVGVSPKHLTVINARGDSMLPTIRNNAPILVDHSSKAIRGDAIFAIVVDGELYIKRVQKIFGGGFVLISDNPAYQPQEIRNPEEVDMIVVGEVKLVCNWF